MSTYGSLAITSLNVLLFLISILLIEPWRRRRLVENVEERSAVGRKARKTTDLKSILTCVTLL